ncbi:MAG: hypothetical protein ABI488_07525 [Polyangiaceae bacterium]
MNADLLVVDDELAERDPVLAQLARAAVSGLAPAGPEFRRGREAVAFGGRPGVLIAAPLCVREYDFSLHAATHAGAQDLKGREALLKYILRPPLATERLTADPDGLVRITLKRAFSDGTWRTPSAASSLRLDSASASKYSIPYSDTTRALSVFTPCSEREVLMNRAWA